MLLLIILLSKLCTSQRLEIDDHISWPFATEREVSAATTYDACSYDIPLTVGPFRVLGVDSQLAISCDSCLNGFILLVGGRRFLTRTNRMFC